MPKPSVENIVVHTKQNAVTGVGKIWDISFTCVTRKGTRFPERKYFGPAVDGENGLTRAQVWDAMRAVAIEHDNVERTPKDPTPPEFEGRLDATAGSPTPLDPADYPEGEAPAQVV